MSLRRDAILSRFPIRQTHIDSIGVPGRQLRACLRAPVSVILMGDFNEKTPCGFANRHISTLLHGVIPPSWPGFLPLFYLDRLYMNRDWKVRSVRVGTLPASLIASDHAPVTATLEFKMP